MKTAEEWADEWINSDLGWRRSLTEQIREAQLDALSSADITNKWVPVEDIKPLLATMMMNDAKTNFLAKHGDKFR